MARSSPTQTPLNILVWCATDRWIWILRLTQLCYHSWLVLSESSNSSRALTLLTNYTLISGSSKLTQFLLACMRVRYGLLPSYDKVGRWITFTEMAFGSAEKGSWSQRHHSSWCVVRECGLEPLQFNWFCAAMRLYNSLTQCNSFTMRKVLQADMQLSSRSSECCSSHIFSAMEGLTQSYMFKQKLLSCEPIDLNRFVVDLRDRHLEFWTPFSDNHPRERNSKRVNLSPVVRNACTKSTGHPSSL